jgi:hypothetical protein
MPPQAASGKPYKFLTEVEPKREAAGSVPSASPVYRSFYCKDGFPTLDCSTLYELFENACVKYPDNDCLGRHAS